VVIVNGKVMFDDNVMGHKILCVFVSLLHETNLLFTST